MFKTIIGIYKIPPKWNNIENKYFQNIDTIECNNMNYVNIDNIDKFNEHKNRLTSINDNIYFRIFLALKNKFDIKDGHYIFIDETLKISKKMYNNDINIWILKDYNDLMNFRFGDLYFLRGNYLNFYNKFIIEKSKIIFYSATSLVYSYFNKINNNKIKKNDIFKINNVQKICNLVENNFYKRINYALVHEDEVYKKIFKHSKIILFNKFSSDKFNYLNLERNNDFIFIGDAVQTTKNHELVIEFINYCELNELKFKIIYISNFLILKNKIKVLNPKDLKFVKLNIYHSLTPEVLNILYNKTKINLIFSGRDACPRTISESLAAGCYNIALDTLSDGKTYFYSLFGEILGDANGDLIMRASTSISYTNYNNIFKKIIDIQKKNFDHKKISIESKKNFSIDNLIKQINFDPNIQYNNIS